MQIFIGLLASSLFANQSQDQVLSNNYCVSPYEVHGKSVQTAVLNFSVLEDCPALDYDENVSIASSSSDGTAGQTQPSSNFVSSSSSSSATQVSLFITICRSCCMMLLLLFQL